MQKITGQKSTDVCALCCAAASAHPIIDGSQAFCCAGCHAVYTILLAKNQLDGFEKHPVFMQALRSGLISNPAILEQIQQQKAEVRDAERNKLYIEISEMWCPSCAEIIRLMLLKERGVVNCVVDYATDLAAVEYSPRYVSKETLIGIIKQLGYTPIALDSTERKAVSKDLYLRFIVAAFCALNVMMFSYALYATYFDYDGEGYGLLFAWLSCAASLPVVFYSGWPIWRRFTNSFVTGILGMETLVVIGVLAAFAASMIDLLQGGTRVYFDTMSVIIVFVLLGKIIEARAKFSAKESLMRLTRTSPRRGRKRMPDGSLQFVLVKDLLVGDELVAFPGERIALDGRVIEGEGACDESLMTGEAMPIVKRKGDGVLGGTILVQGHLTYRVAASQADSALQRIIEMVERDIGHKSVYVRAADQIVRWFVPAVICIAASVSAIYWLFPAANDANPAETAWLRALAVLLISCPCAIGIAAPTAESHLLNGLATLGIIVRNRGCLPHLGKESVIVFDKTGTVTEGRYSVRQGLDQISAADRQALYSLSSQSTHPVAFAVKAALGAEKALPIEHLEEVVGHGLRGGINSHRYVLGSERLMRQEGIALIECAVSDESGILSRVYCARDNTCLSCLLLGDRVREDMRSVVRALHPTPTVLLSGDSTEAVATVAKLCGFDQWHSNFSPLEKRELIEKLKAEGKTVCMVGDGINDAPALTSAHIGISVVSAADISIQVSDVLLTTDSMSVIVKMRNLARKGQRIVRQNLFWAFFFNVIGIGLAAFGVLSPIFAAFAMSISSLAVLFNARRLS